MFKDRPILFLATGQTLVWASLYYVFPALLLRWEQDLGWSKINLTAAITMAVLISAFAAPVTGRIIDRGRGDVLMAVSALCGGVCLMLLSRVTDLWQFYTLWALIGLAISGCLYEPCFALVTRCRGTDAKRGIIIITLAAGFAGTISFPATHLLAEAFGWRQAVTLLGLLVILVVAPLLWLGAHGLEAARRSESPIRAAEPELANKFLGKPAFWFLALGFACAALVHGATLHHLLPILDERGLSGDIAVLLAASIGPMQIVGRIAMMLSEKVTSHHGVALTSFAMMASAVLLLRFGGASSPALALFIILFGGAYGTVSILRPVIARDILGARNFGAKSGALAVPYLVGSASAPFLGSVIWGLGGYDTMLIILIVIETLGCTLYAFAHRISVGKSVGQG